ncbi:hypothetical protein HOF92_12895 [bacterium]|jgi:cell division protein FtsB|nr:hypothetical protein [bacterium]
MSQPPELVPLQLKLNNGNEGNSYGKYVLYGIIFSSLFVLFMFVSQIYVNKYEEIQNRKLNVTELKIKVDELELENRKLARKIEELRTPIGQEKIARKQLKLIKPGENIMVWGE